MPLIQRFDQVEIPGNRYRPVIDRRTAAVKLVLDVFGIDEPQIYYPACGDDKSLSVLGNVLLTDVFVHSPDVVRADAETYKVDDEINLVAFFDADMSAEKTLENVPLSAGGLVVWRSYNQGEPDFIGPVLTQDSLVGVVTGETIPILDANTSPYITGEFGVKSPKDQWQVFVFQPYQA